MIKGCSRVRVRVRVTVRARVRVRITSGLHTTFPIEGLARQPYSVMVNHKSGRILIRSSLTSQSLDFVTVHGKALPYLVEAEMVIIPDAH